MIATFVRSIILYIIVLIVMRIMGKREIGQLQPFELAIAIMIADLASIPMTDIGIPISNGIIPIFGLLVMHIIISVLNLKSRKIKELICGKPTILIYQGKIDEKQLKKERYTVSELQEKLRSSNVMDLGDVEYAILETSGDITVRAATPEDFGIMPEYEGISYNLILDGKVIKENLKAINKDYAWLKKQVNKFQVEPEEALVVSINGKGKIFCQAKEKEIEKKIKNQDDTIL